MLTAALIELLAKVAIEVAEDVIPALVKATHKDATDEQHQEAVQQIADKVIDIRQRQSVAEPAECDTSKE